MENQPEITNEEGLQKTREESVHEMLDNEMDVKVHVNAMGGVEILAPEGFIDSARAEMEESLEIRNLAKKMEEKIGQTAVIVLNKPVVLNNKVLDALRLPGGIILPDNSFFGKKKLYGALIDGVSGDNATITYEGMQYSFPIKLVKEIS